MKLADASPAEKRWGWTFGDNGGLMSVQDAADDLGISRATMYRIIAAGKVWASDPDPTARGVGEVVERRMNVDVGSLREYKRRIGNKARRRADR